MSDVSLHRWEVLPYGPSLCKGFHKMPCVEVITYYQNEVALVEITLTFHLLERKLGTSTEGRRLPITFRLNRIRVFHFERSFFFSCLETSTLVSDP